MNARQFKAALADTRKTVVPDRPPVVELDGSKGRLKCGRCSSARGLARSGAGPHWGRLDCARCGGFLSWLSADAAISLGLVEREVDS